ncbi:TPA: hypothetical protein OT945_003661 [Klebsiella pneumoniae]|uniref:hypothetical protein n=1 Tax=Bacteria TaxID=2 RepID=UPI00115C0417|nr:MULTISPECIES: hypothetical protein [Bacteria]HBW7357727.1 hypothetical protein [Klebsiella pneumoniae]HCB1287066.1 hypothetical protein [Klebsiella pneumoniae]HCQ7871330.1 hypothetical protein [Klebsiella pneumoniae]HCT8210375.1 hypothetical protein [Klebsiella pneumoniae]HCT8224444.1 hypothetical protein [Klebsiella pneumoniae]
MKDVGIVKNPLTIIAIFAGLVEVSATTVLPFIDKTLQETFIWFLMVFPTLLVTYFFGTLLIKPQALYAPSDYRDDDAFVKMHEQQRVKMQGNSVSGKSSISVSIEPTVTKGTIRGS